MSKMTIFEDTTIRTISIADLLGRPLNEIEKKFSPHPLYLKGVMKIPLPRPRVSIVGSRRASKHGIETTKEITKILVKEDVVIVSGLAEGIDTSAHETAIEHSGKTIGVIGTPLNKSYPRTNQYLQELIMQKYLVISQFKIGMPVQRGNFVMRNRTMALISDATIIVEAGDKSGSLHQGWEALRLGRSLFIWKSIVEDQSLTWPKQMIDYGAIALYDVTDVFDYLPSSIEVSNIP